jgi:hypothetical protein
MGINEQQVDVDSIVDELLGEAPINAEVSVTIPSGKTVTLRPITFEEEKQLVGLSEKGMDPSRLLIEKCVSDLKIDDILLIDKIYILFKLRELSFGSVYKFMASCPACRHQQTISIDINDLPVTELDGEDQEEIELPMSKKKIVVRRASVKDEQIVMNTERVFDNLWKFVISFEGNDNPMVIQKVLTKLAAGDINRILSVVMCEGYGLNNEVMFRCGSCGKETPMPLPLTKNFFSAS